MNQLVDNFDIEGNFWESNPQIRYITPFAELYKQDRSRNKDSSSRAMWAIVLYVDPVHSKLYRMTPEKRTAEIKKNYIKEFDPEESKDIIAAYVNMLMSPAKRGFKNWNDKLVERDQFIAEMKYGEDTYDMLDKMMEKTAKMWDQFEKVKAALEEEEDQGRVRGGQKKSATESGVL